MTKYGREIVIEKRAVSGPKSRNVFYYLGVYAMETSRLFAVIIIA